MELVIHSKTHGRRIVYFDDEDAAEILKYKWHIRKEFYGFYCGTNILKDGKKTTLKMHRLIMKPEKGVIVDHKDGDGLNNKRSNLRLCTQSQNLANGGKYSNNSSGFKGVSWHPKTKKWQVLIGVNKKILYGGRFEDKREAAKRYNELAIEHHGEFAKLNKI